MVSLEGDKLEVAVKNGKGRLASAAFSTSPPRRLKAGSRPARHLPEYAGAFAENGNHVSVLPHLTDQDLKDIGVLLGHRRYWRPSLNSESRRHPRLRWRRQGTADRTSSTGAGRAATN